MSNIKANLRKESDYQLITCNINILSIWLSLLASSSETEKNSPVYPRGVLEKIDCSSIFL